MSANNEQIKQPKPVNEEIADWLKAIGFTIDGNIATLITKGQAMQMNINGQQVRTNAPDIVTKMTYVGEGCIKGESGEVPIYGYEIERDGRPVGPTEYVDSLYQFQLLFT